MSSLFVCFTESYGNPVWLIFFHVLLSRYKQTNKQNKNACQLIYSMPYEPNPLLVHVQIDYNWDSFYRLHFKCTVNYWEGLVLFFCHRKVHLKVTC